MRDRQNPSKQAGNERRTGKGRQIILIVSICLLIIGLVGSGIYLYATYVPSPSQEATNDNVFTMIPNGTEGRESSNITYIGNGNTTTENAKGNDAADGNSQVSNMTNAISTSDDSLAYERDALAAMASDMQAVYDRKSKYVDYDAASEFPLDKGVYNVLLFQGDASDPYADTYHDIWKVLKASMREEQFLSLISSQGGYKTMQYVVSGAEETMTFTVTEQESSSKFVSMVLTRVNDPSTVTGKDRNGRNINNPLALGESTYNESYGKPSAKQYGTH